MISAFEPPRGDQDDITLWIDLPAAQKLLDKPGQISAILAIECNCAADPPKTIRGDLARVLPGTQVIEFASKALARAERGNRRPRRPRRRSSGSRPAALRKRPGASGCLPC